MLRNKAVLLVVGVLFVIVVIYNINFFLGKKAPARSQRNAVSAVHSGDLNKLERPLMTSPFPVPRDKEMWKRDPFAYKLNISPERSDLSAEAFPSEMPHLVLKGIVSDTFGEYICYIEIDRAKAVPMRKGDKLDDIKVIDISSRNVVLKWHGETISLSNGAIKTIDKPRSR